MSDPLYLRRVKRLRPPAGTLAAMNTQSLASASQQDDPVSEKTGGRRRWRRRAGLLAIVAGLALLTAACAGGATPSRGPSSASGGSGLSSYVSHALAFSRCVRAHGVPNFPDPDSSGVLSKAAMRQLGISPSRLRAAMDPCQNLLPGGPPPLSAQQQHDYLTAAACMRSHGITNFPDPTFSGGGVHFPIPPGVDASSARFTQARQTCARLIPAGLPYSGSGG
jgi:hypothetical protein